LSREAQSILGRARIGMLALKAGRMPLVNPAAYSFAAGSLWMTTSRYAAKNVLAKRDPRAAFFVDGGNRGVLLRGTLEVFDPLSLNNQVRAALAGPGMYLGMAEYALRNVPFVAGYALDMMRLPREWMPYNRIVLQLHPNDAEVIDIGPFPAAQAARVPAVPAEVSRQLAGVPRGYACWYDGRAHPRSCSWCAGGRIAKPLPPVAHGGRMRAGDLRRPYRSGRDRRALLDRRRHRPLDGRAACRARDVVARFHHHDGDSPLCTALARRRGISGKAGSAGPAHPAFCRRGVDGIA
jgi:hypothetical protein